MGAASGERGESADGAGVLPVSIPATSAGLPNVMVKGSSPEVGPNPPRSDSLTPDQRLALLSQHNRITAALLGIPLPVWLLVASVAAALAWHYRPTHKEPPVATGPAVQTDSQLTITPSVGP